MHCKGVACYVSTRPYILYDQYKMSMLFQSIHELAEKTNMKHFTLLIIFFFIYMPVILYAWPIPHSGQTQCYDTEKIIECPDPTQPFYGQSGHYMINPRSFTKLDSQANDLPDEAEEWFMLRDNVTGLIWEVKHAKDNITDYSNPNDFDNTYTWNTAISKNSENSTDTYNEGENTTSFILEMNRNQYGGFQDWRIPSIKELASILNLGKKYPAMDLAFFDNNMSEIYWSSTSYVNRENSAWCVQMSNGKCCDQSISKKNYVRAVRGAYQRPFDHKAFNEDRTFTDIQTGLMWELEGSEIKKNWKNALAYCASVNIGNYTDWRLPAINELLSIVDFSKQSLVSEVFWSSTTYQNIPYYAWTFQFNDESNNFIDKSIENTVRCVRGGQIQLMEHLYILYPKQSSILMTGSKISILWQTADLKGKVSISLSRQGGKTKTFETLINETENDGHFEWQVTGLSSASCVLKIEPLSSPEKFTQQGLFTIKHSDIHIYSNLSTDFFLTGPQKYTGTGNRMTIDNAYPGHYTATYAPIACFQTPAQESKSLTFWENISFSGFYIESFPEPVQDLDANYDIKTLIGNNQITVAWQPADQCLKGYGFIWDRQENTIPGNSITGVTYQTISPPLDDGYDHWFHIKAINIHGSASKTAHLGPFYIDTTQLPSAPDTLMIEQRSEKGVQLKWIPDDKLISYTIYKCQSEQGIFYPIHSEPVNYEDAFYHGFWDTRVKPDTSYFYKIKAINHVGLESETFSNTVSVTIPEDKKNFDVIFESKKHQIVSAGDKKKYKLFLTKTQDFQGHLDIWCTDLPEHATYQISVNYQESDFKVENVELLPAILELSISTGSAIKPGDYQFKLQCLNVDNVNGSQQKAYAIDLTVVPRTGGIFVDFNPERIHKNEQVSVFGYIYPPKENLEICLEAWKDNEKYAIETLRTQLSGWFENNLWVKTFVPGAYRIKATWSDSVLVPFTAEKKDLIIEKIHPQLILSSQQNQEIKLDEDFTIKGQIDPIYGSEPIILSVLTPDTTLLTPFEIHTDETGQFHFSHKFFTEKGKYTFKAFFLGNESSIGCESNEYEVMVGHTGCSIIVGGGVAETQNTKWKVTKKLVTDAYIDFKRMGLNDSLIYLMINSQMIDINNDEIPDDIVSQSIPSTSCLTNIITNQFSNLLNEKETLYIYMMGHGTDDAKFKVFGNDEYISSKQLKSAIDDLQEKTQCSVVIILEFCYSGAFIKTLSGPKRIIITSAGNEEYNTDNTGLISLSRFLFPRLYLGDSLKKAFEYARKELTGKKYPAPLLDDNGDGLANDDDGRIAEVTYLPKKPGSNKLEISQINLSPVLDGKNTLEVSLTVESKPENITKVWAQVIPPNDMITSGNGTIQFEETRLNHEEGTRYSGEVKGFSYDGTYIVIFYAQNKFNEVTEPVQYIVRATNIGRRKDFNQDGLIDLEDVIIVLRSLSGIFMIENIELADAVHLIQHLGGY